MISLTLFQTITTINDPGKMVSENNFWKRGNAANKIFWKYLSYQIMRVRLYFLQMFSSWRSLKLVVWIDSLPNDKISDKFNFKAFAEDKINVTKKVILLFCRNSKKHCWKRRKCWLPAFSPFPAMFSKSLFLRSLKVATVWYRVNPKPYKKNFPMYLTMIKSVYKKDQLFLISIFSSSHSVFKWHFSIFTNISPQYRLDKKQVMELLIQSLHCWYSIQSF